jgi:hypothetical protein
MSKRKTATGEFDSQRTGNARRRRAWKGKRQGLTPSARIRVQGFAFDEKAGQAGHLAASDPMFRRESLLENRV